MGQKHNKMNLRTNGVLLFIFSATMFLSSFALYGEAQSSKTHRVEPGETAYSISKSHNITLSQLYALNPGAEKGVKAGTELVLPQTSKAENSDHNYIYHTIEKKETLYSVSRKYSVGMQNIIDANMGLTADSFEEGKIIRIPKGMTQKPEMVVTYNLHKVQKGETAYSIAQLYNISIETLNQANPSLKTTNLKKGTLVKIPKYSEKKLTQNEIYVQEEKAGSLLRERSKINKVQTVKIGLLFPFSDQSDAQSSRFIEYIEGFLLAVEDFKEEGYSAEIYIFDTESGSSSKKLQGLLETEELKNLNVLIGGISQEQIGLLADFAKKRKIRYVIPFNSKNNDVLSNDYVFQMNTPQNYLYPMVTKTFMNKFKNSKIIFIDSPTNDKADFITQLQSEINASGVLSSTVQLSDNTASDLAACLSSTQRNIIVPSSGALTTLGKLTTTLLAVKKDNPSVQLSLFGYPEWQTYNGQISDNLHKLDTYFYSSFFVDNSQANAKRFSQRFNTKYGKPMLNVYPKYGLLGYDTGNYFLNAVKLYGTNFENHLSKYLNTTIQSAMAFKRIDNWSGFINSGYYIVHYGVSSTDKTEYNK